MVITRSKSSNNGSRITTSNKSTCKDSSPKQPPNAWSKRSSSQTQKDRILGNDFNNLPIEQLNESNFQVSQMQQDQSREDDFNVPLGEPPFTLLQKFPGERSQLFNPLELFFKTWNWITLFIIVVFTGTILISALFLFLSSYFVWHPRLVKPEPHPDLYIPRGPAVFTRADLFSLPAKYEKVSLVFRDLRHITEKSNVPSKEQLISLIQQHITYSQQVHRGLWDQYSQYSKFVYETIRDLENTRNLVKQKTPSDKNVPPVEVERKLYWRALIRGILNQPSALTYGEQILDTYQNFLVSQKPKYQTPSIVQSLENNTLCHSINETLKTDLAELSYHQSETNKLQIIKQSKYIKDMYKKLQKPCHTGLQIYNISVAVACQLERVMAECVRESRDISKYTQPWEKCIGGDEKQKLEFHNSKMLELIKTSVERAIEMLKELM